MLSEAICWNLSNNYTIPYLIHLLDDLLVISPPDVIPAPHILTVQKHFSELGIPIAQEKSWVLLHPSSLLPLTLLGQVSLLASPSCSKHGIISLLGHLNFAMCIFPQGCPFISHLLSLASSVHTLKDPYLMHAATNLGYGQCSLNNGTAFPFSITTLFHLPSTSNCLHTQLPQSASEVVTRMLVLFPPSGEAYPSDAVSLNISSDVVRVLLA